MDLTVRECRQKVADCIQAHVKQPLATIASATGLSKSSVYRHRQAIELQPVSRIEVVGESDWRRVAGPPGLGSGVSLWN